jgi:glutamine amidotransferase
MIAIIDYGMGNLRSVEKAVQSQGFDVKISSDPDFIVKADKVILPGVGAFPDAMDNMQRNGMADVIHEIVKRGTPLLGICLGMQLLFEKGYEIEERDGLGIFKGKIERLPSGLKTPHMGWNSLEIKRECKILKDVEDGSFMYFVHSYYAVETGEEEVAATCDYGGVVPAVICKGNVFGTQFHPEKSGEKGLIIYKNFGELV